MFVGGVLRVVSECRDSEVLLPTTSRGGAAGLRVLRWHTIAGELRVLFCVVVARVAGTFAGTSSLVVLSDQCGSRLLCVVLQES